MKKKNFIKAVTFCFFAFLIILNSCKDDEIALPGTPSFVSTNNGVVIN